MTLACALDTETSDLPRRGVEKGSKDYPWFCSLGLVLFDTNGTIYGRFSALVKADGRAIAPEAEKTHGISTRMTEQLGIGELRALSTLIGFVEAAEILTGFRVQFDRDVLESALIRLGKTTKMLIRERLRVIDLIEPSAHFCKIPNPVEDMGGYKWPKLDEAREIMLGRPPRAHGAWHEAFDDAWDAHEIFLKLAGIGALRGVSV